MEFWNDYFSKIRDLLIPKGVFSMQTIVIDNKYFKNYIKKIDFIQKYIFPGGMLPCMNELDKIAKNLNFTFKLNRKMAIMEVNPNMTSRNNDIDLLSRDISLPNKINAGGFDPRAGVPQIYHQGLTNERTLHSRKMDLSKLMR